MVTHTPDTEIPVFSPRAGWQGPLTLAAIAEAAAARHGLTTKDLRTLRRFRALARARQEAMALMRAQTDPEGRPRFSYARIGRFFGQDHATVVYAVKAHARRQAEEARG